MTDTRTCHYCHKPGTKTGKSELRPYGPGGAWVCFACATETPEREAETKAGFTAVLDGASAIGGGVATLTDHGVEPGHPFDGQEPTR